MSDDLHTRLHTAITTRLELAKAATSAGNSVWTYQDGDRSPTIIYGDDQPKKAWIAPVQAEIWQCEDEDDGCPEVARGLRAEGKHIAANDPAFAVRACERDLRVLQRHPAGDDPEITDLATVYLETP